MDTDFFKKIEFEEDILNLRMLLVDGIQYAENLSGPRRDRALINLGLLGFTIEALNRTGGKSLYDIKMARTLAYYEDEDFSHLGEIILEKKMIPAIPIFWDEQ